MFALTQALAQGPQYGVLQGLRVQLRVGLKAPSGLTTSGRARILRSTPFHPPWVGRQAGGQLRRMYTLDGL